MKARLTPSSPPLLSLKERGDSRAFIARAGRAQ